MGESIRYRDLQQQALEDQHRYALASFRSHMWILALAIAVLTTVSLLVNRVGTKGQQDLACGVDLGAWFVALTASLAVKLLLLGIRYRLFKQHH